MLLGVAISDINTTLSAAWGGTYINDFIDRGRIKKVYLQADAPARMQPEDLAKWYVRNERGEMVPLATVLKVAVVPGQLARLTREVALVLVRTVRVALLVMGVVVPLTSTV